LKKEKEKEEVWPNYPPKAKIHQKKFEGLPMGVAKPSPRAKTLNQFLINF